MPFLRRDTEANELTLSLSGAPDFQDALAKVRTIPGRRFDGDRKLWAFPNDSAVAERLMQLLRPSADAALTQWVRSSRSEREAELTTNIADDAKLLIPWSDTLYDFQRAYVDFAAGHPHNLLADDMGLGKTLQALSTVAELVIRDTDDTYKAQAPRLVVCPNSAKGVWAREITKWLGKEEPHQIIDASTPKARTKQLQEIIAANGWAIANYEQIRAKKVTEEFVVNHRDGSSSTRDKVEWIMKEPLFETTPWLAAIADEVHRAKNHKSQTARGLWRIQAPIMLGLSGTPVQNHPAELWSVLRWLYPEQYHEQGRRYNGAAWAYWPFYDQYVDDYDSGYGKVIVGVKNPDALRFELKDRLVRRTKGEKLSLPDKVRKVVPVTLSKAQRKAYTEAENQFWLTIQQAIAEGDEKLAREAEAVITGKKKVYEMTNGAARTVRLRQIASTLATLGGDDESAKLDAVMETVEDMGDKQLVVFTEFVATADALVARLRKKKVPAEAFTGAVDSAARTEFEDRFQMGEIQVMVGTIAAMRESITLTAADTVGFVELAWNPSWNEQAEDRLHRNGQKNQVTVLIWEAQDTVDTDKVRPTNEAKEIIVSSVIRKDAVANV